MTRPTAQADRRVEILALRVTADLLAFVDEAPPEVDLLGADLEEAIFDTTLDMESMDIELFDPKVSAELIDHVKGLLAHLNS